MNSLISLSLLRSFAEKNTDQNDRLGLFLPFIEDSLKNFNQNILFTIEDMRDKVSRDEGITLPLVVIKALLRRCARKGLVKQEDGRFYRTDAKLNFTNISEERRSLEKKHQTLITAIESYAAENKLPMEQGARHALGVFIENNFRSLSVGQVPEIQGGGEYEDYSWLALFFQKELEHNSDVLDTLASIVVGRSVYDAAYLPGFLEERGMAGLVVYIDSPIIFSALGFAREEEEKYAREALETLRRANVVCRIFDYTVSEAKGILRSMHASWGSTKLANASNSYLRFALRRGKTRDDVYMLLNDFSGVVERELHIREEDAPGRDRHFVYDESSLAERLTDSRRELKGLDDPRVRHDVNCIAAVLTKRRDSRARTISKSKALFVTSSPMTIYNARRWWSETENRTDIAPIFSLYDLANYAWLYGGAQEHSTLQKDSLLAAFAAMMVPRSAVWNSALAKLEKDVCQGRLTEEQAFSIIVSADTESFLAEYDHLGCFDKEETAELSYRDVFDRAKRELAEEIVSKERAEASSKISKLNSDIALERENREKIEEEYAKVKQDHDSEAESIDRITRNIEKSADRASYFIVAMLLIAVSALGYLLVSSFLFPKLDQCSQSNSLSVVLAAIPELIVAAVLWFIGHIFAVRKKISSIIANYFLGTNEAD